MPANSNRDIIKALKDAAQDEPTTDTALVPADDPAEHPTAAAMTEIVEHLVRMAVTARRHDTLVYHDKTIIAIAEELRDAARILRDDTPVPGSLWSRIRRRAEAAEQQTGGGS